ncbi:unnamed protein product [Prorocentrum cordatum]|uniref:ISXO2-like transposase domain-containing protein n=1 Tax=Prorocentrum cordatum TaxID=2364126 RepID=A0ABN9PPQ4_9DINO|nr:unnamed protein product [Polarella glacialis]
MAVYGNWSEFSAAVKDMDDGINRGEFLKKARHATIKNPEILPDNEVGRAFAFAQAFGLAPEHMACPSCDEEYVLLRGKRGECGERLIWRGPRHDGGCDDCNGEQPSAANMPFFDGTRTGHWMDKLDCLVMWLADYIHKTTIFELSHIDHKVIDAWLLAFRERTSDWYDLICPTSNKKLWAPDSGVRKRPAARPAPKRAPAMKVAQQKKKPPRKVSKKFANQVKKTIGKRVLVADESFLNKNKPGKLNKAARPKKDQIWIWGAVLQGKARTHFMFRILEHPADAKDGNPRGHKEMLDNLNMLNVGKGDIFVSDKWGATISPAKAIRHQKGLAQSTLRHEVVNHDDGEIVNAKGFTTNAIESKWGILKRWLKSKYGGKLPNYKDRVKWRYAINEYQARCYYYVPLSKGLRIFAIA